MEGSLGVRGFVAQEDGSYVLILVLMEDTLGVPAQLGIKLRNGAS